MRASRKTAFIELLVVSLIWSFASIVIKVTLEGVSTLPFLTVRFAISSVIALFAIKHIARLFKHSPQVSFLAIAYGALSTTFALGGVFLGLQSSTVLTLSIVQATEPVLLMIVAAYALREHHTKRVKIGGAIALLGTFITLANPLLATNDIMGSLKGNFFFVFYIISDLLSVLILKKLLRKKIDAWALTHLSFIVGFLTLLPITLMSKSALDEISRLPSLDFKYIVGIVYMALFSGTIAYALRAKAQKTLSVSDTSLFGYLTPIGSSILAVALLREILDIPFILGSLFVVFGIFLAEFKKSRKQR